MLEQAPGFFASLWIHSFYVSDASATALGVMYLCLRACYPVIWAVKGGENGNGKWRVCKCCVRAAPQSPYNTHRPTYSRFTLFHNSPYTVTLPPFLLF